MKKAIRISKKIFDVLCWIIIAVLVISVGVSVVARFQGTNPSVFGYSVFRVSSGSMSPELEIGDVILGKAVDDPMSIKVGDIVTYKGSGELSGKLITHKVIVAPEDVDGEIMLRTKGVANEIGDSPINVDRVVSIVICEIPLLASFYNFFFSPWGLLTIVALIIIIFIDEVVSIIKNLTNNNNMKNEKKDINDIIGRIKSESENSGEIDADTESDNN